MRRGTGEDDFREIRMTCFTRRASVLDMSTISAPRLAHGTATAVGTRTEYITRWSRMHVHCKYQASCAVRRSFCSRMVWLLGRFWP